MRFNGSGPALRVAIQHEGRPWYISHWRWWFYGIGGPLAVLGYVMFIQPH